jgi:LCP family protein required for cell wall assembly
VLLSVVFLYIGYNGYALYHFVSKVNNVQALENPIELKKADRINILLLGVDERATDTTSGRSDSILVVSIDPVAKNICLFSVMRDSYVEIPGHGYQKINAAYAFGGPELTMQVISTFTNLPIQYYMETDFEGFIGLVDELGGIEIDVEKDMVSSQSTEGTKYYINLKKGLQIIDGDKTLQYVRFRSDLESDYGRAKRQRKFLTAIANEIQQTSSILKYPKLLKSMEPYISTNMNFKTMFRLASLGVNVNVKDITSAQLPPQHLLTQDTINGAWVITYEQAELNDYVNQLLEGEIDVNGKSIVN